jgi:glutamyl-tRNA synthetase
MVRKSGNIALNDKVIRAYALKNAVEHSGKAVISGVIPALFAHGLEKKGIKEIMPKVGIIVNEVNAMGLEVQKLRFSEVEKLIGHRPIREGIPELPGAVKGKVIMRFAPSPSGALHIGHAKTASLSYVYIQKYGGKLYIRIDDTNADNIYTNAHKLIEKDSDFLFKGQAEVVYQSQFIDSYYKYAEILINKGKSYVCECDPEKFKKLIWKNKACPCRDLEINEHLARWHKMLDKGKNGYKQGEVVLRFKSELDNPNPAFRDFPLARINESSHPIQKKKYRVWPLMNFAVAINDLEMNITHAIRAKEHRDNATRQEMIFKALGMEKKIPWAGFVGRYKFKKLELSSTKISQGIKDGKYSGWDDPKLPTVSSLRKRGYKPEAFWKLAEHIGLSEVDKVIDEKDFFNVLDKFNDEVGK